MIFLTLLISHSLPPRIRRSIVRFPDELKDGVAGRDNDYGAFAFGQQSGRTSGAARGFGYVEPRFTGSGDVPISTLQVCPRPSSHSVTHTRGHSVLGAVCL